MKNLINIDGKWYILLGMYGGQFYTTNLFDINNDVAKSGVIWFNQPFFYDHEKWYGFIIKKFVKYGRVLKQLIIGDAFGKHFVVAKRTF